jgi:formate hydrogenlyase subunit 4
METTLLLKLSGILILVLAPLPLLGLIGKVKSLWAGRKGPSILQPVHDVVRLLKKGEVVSIPTGLIFAAAPSIQLAAALFAGLLVPMTGGASVISFQGDFVVFSYVLALGKLAGILAAMESGSSFEGMGAAREAFFSSLAEPGFFVLVGSLAAIAGTPSFSDLLVSVSGHGSLGLLVAALGSAGFFVMLLTECSRLPVDDPATHLELTMVHEAMILDYSGPDLAYIQYAVAVKMTVIASLAAALAGAVLLPAGAPVPASIALSLGVLAVAGVGVGCVESLMARLRLRLVPQFIFLMTAFGFLALASILISRFGGAA